MHKNINKPIILVGHNLGGILIQGALIFSSQISDEKDEYAIHLSTAGVVFLAVPYLECEYPEDPSSSLPGTLEKIVRHLRGDDGAILENLTCRAGTL
ncbi:hypothetical protein MAC_06717 [Metarhizium acridum CQMa 102]|uniref:Uncharacterized protein n=1 Tax=Metarhizium acridum (strain CQMa 102) TaxID=655827 RepID=E9EA19_METAQ|nr:uncharacterized protein MAC_06717 [Metarhizium acridum CQMa 102]EFY87269.1 hypothetical protein MAC_06717 [Metarhizium acridum CQMa 102]